MSKSLKALENIRYIIVFDERLVDEDGDDDPKKIFIDEICPQDYAIIKKELKALDIIKDEFEITFNDKEQTINFQSVEYPYPHIRSSLTRTIKDKEKYDLLKEALCE